MNSYIYLCRKYWSCLIYRKQILWWQIVANCNYKKYQNYRAYSAWMTSIWTHYYYTMWSLNSSNHIVRKSDFKNGLMSLFNNQEVSQFSSLVKKIFVLLDFFSSTCNAIWTQKLYIYLEIHSWNTEKRKWQNFYRSIVNY